MCDHSVHCRRPRRELESVSLQLSTVFPPYNTDCSVLLCNTTLSWRREWKRLLWFNMRAYRYTHHDFWLFQGSGRSAPVLVHRNRGQIPPRVIPWGYSSSCHPLSAPWTFQTTSVWFFSDPRRRICPTHWSLLDLIHRTRSNVCHFFDFSCWGLVYHTHCDIVLVDCRSTRFD